MHAPKGCFIHLAGLLGTVLLVNPRHLGDGYFGRRIVDELAQDQRQGVVERHRHRVGHVIDTERRRQRAAITARCYHALPD
jgi:hypothetical protein